MRRRLQTLRFGHKLFVTLQEVDPPGVVDGVLTDPKAYFFWLINRQENQPADDWAMVLSNSGIPAGLPPGVFPTDNGYYGMTQQMDSGGNVRGRIFLPTGVPDPNGYFARAYSPLKDAPGQPGHLLWEWRYLEGPPYVPVDTGGGFPQPIPPSDVEQRLETLEAQTANHEGRITTLEQRPTSGVQFGDKIALRMDSQMIVGAVSGGPTAEDQLIEFIAKDHIHAWESFVLEKGE